MESTHVEYNTPKYSHLDIDLEKGVKPITVCLKTTSEQESLLSEEFEKFAPYSRQEDYDRPSSARSPLPHYFVSQISDKNKYSEGYMFCTGIVVVGIDKETKQNISFISHQNPMRFLDVESREKAFTDSFVEMIQNFISRCEPRSVDALIVGGNNMGDNYNVFKKSVQILSAAISPVLGFKPIVATGPKLGGGVTSIFFDNKNRRLYLLMPEQSHSKVYEDFKPDDIEYQLKKYEETE